MITDTVASPTPSPAEAYVVLSYMPDTVLSILCRIHLILNSKTMRQKPALVPF